MVMETPIFRGDQRPGEALAEFGARVRRAEAVALYGEGMTMEEIAEKFGVTRQRVSALLRDAGGQVPGDRDRNGGHAEPAARTPDLL